MNTTTASPDDGIIDVVIVGAGPIGLATACALAHHGVHFRIIERSHGISGESKGHNVIARAQELLNAIGVRDVLAEKGYRAPFTQFLLDRAPLARLDTRASPSPFGPVLFSNQGVMEQVLTDVLTERGIQIEYGREVFDIRAGDNDVSMVVVSVDEDGKRKGREESLTCRYLVGADGAAGTVRKAVGLDYELQEFEGGRCVRSTASSRGVARLNRTPPGSSCSRTASPASCPCGKGITAYSCWKAATPCRSATRRARRWWRERAK